MSIYSLERTCQIVRESFMKRDRLNISMEVIREKANEMKYYRIPFNTHSLYMYCKIK